MQVIAVVGPTATGKSDLALALARQLDGEIVNADALQLYRGMDVGTAKVPAAERGGIPHHVLDVLDVRDEATLAGYQRAAGAAIADVLARGRRPVLVGGSGLYVRAALDVLDIPPTDPAVRARWEGVAREDGPAALHDRLAIVDPVAAGRIPGANVRRVVRALEVVELTGRPFSASLPEPRYLRRTVQIGLRVQRPVLAGRIGLRVRRMWDAGLLEEVAALVPLGLRTGRTASRAVGYAQALAELDGTLGRAEAQDETARLTRRLARRQESWFGRDPRITWLDATAPGLARRAQEVLRAGAPS